MIVTAILLCRLLNFSLCMKLPETKQKLFQLHHCTLFGHGDLIIPNIMEDAAVGELPAGHFLCLAAASWLHVDHRQSHEGTPPPHYGWGNTWSQPLLPGSWAEVLAIRRRPLFVFALVIFQRSLAENVFILSKLFHCTWLPGITPPQKAVSTKHFSVASRSFSRKLLSVVVGGMLFLFTGAQYIEK